MEEVDKIIVNSLKTLNCDINDEITSLAEFDVETVVRAAIVCLKAIDKDYDLPNSLPQNTAAKFRLGTTMADYCKDLGYKSDIGYQTFLYTNETDLRRLFMFLIEKLPRESGTIVSENLAPFELIKQKISHQCERELASPWLPPHLQQRFRKNPTDFIARVNVSKLHIPYTNSHATAKEDPSNYLFVCEDLKDGCPGQRMNPDSSNFISSVFEENSSHLITEQHSHTEDDNDGIPDNHFLSRVRKQLSKLAEDACRKANYETIFTGGGKPANISTNLAHLVMMGEDQTSTSNESEENTKVDAEKSAVVLTAEEKEAKRKAEYNDLEESLASQKDMVAALRNDLDKKKDFLAKFDDEKMKMIEAKKQGEKDLKFHQKVVDLLPEAELNLQKLQELIETHQNKIQLLHETWEKTRSPLESELNAITEEAESANSLLRRKRMELEEIQNGIVEIISDNSHKELQHSQMKAELENMKKGPPRASYTQRILEIVESIEKQKVQIDEILKDTRDVQKEINTLSGKLDRCFTVADEAIFYDAKRIENARKAYKFLAAIQQNWDNLVKCIEETSTLVREIRDLEEHLSLHFSDSGKKTDESLAFDELKEDYHQLRAENKQLMSDVQKLKQQTKT